MPFHFSISAYLIYEKQVLKAHPKRYNWFGIFIGKLSHTITIVYWLEPIINGLPSSLFDNNMAENLNMVVLHCYIRIETKGDMFKESGRQGLKEYSWLSMGTKWYRCYTKADLAMCWVEGAATHLYVCFIWLLSSSSLSQKFHTKFLTQCLDFFRLSSLKNHQNKF